MIVHYFHVRTHDFFYLSDDFLKFMIMMPELRTYIVILLTLMTLTLLFALITINQSNLTFTMPVILPTDKLITGKRDVFCLFVVVSLKGVV